MEIAQRPRRTRSVRQVAVSTRHPSGASSRPNEPVTGTRSKALSSADRGQSMVRGLVAGLIVAIVCALAGCGSAAVMTSSHADTAGDDRVALAANDEQSDPSGGVDNRTGIAAWSMRASDGGWTEVSEPEGVPEGRMATIGCTGPSGSLTFAAGGAGRQTLLLDPGGSQWRAAATPPWLVPPMGSGPVLEVGNSGGMSFWAGRTLYRFDAATSKWAETRYDAPADVKAVASIGRDRIAAVSLGAGRTPILSTLTP